MRPRSAQFHVGELTSRGCWGELGSHWKAPQPESVGKLEAESPTSWSVIWDLVEPRAADGRRLEVVVDGFPLFGGCQLVVDTTVVPHRGAENLDGVVLERGRRRKERTCPELVGPRRRARLVVLGIEVGGRMSVETTSFLSQLAKAFPGKKLHS